MRNEHNLNGLKYIISISSTDSEIVDKYKFGLFTFKISVFQIRHFF